MLSKLTLIELLMITYSYDEYIQQIPEVGEIRNKTQCE